MSGGGRGAVALLVVITALALAGPSAGYGERTFNANEQTSALGYAVDTTIVLVTHQAAQSFTPSVSLVLENVTLHVQNVGGQTDALSVTVQGDAAGKPDGNPIASSERVGTGILDLDFPFDPPPEVSAGVKYWIVASCAATQGYTWFHAGADRVPGESAQATGGTWSAASATDLTYVTYGLPLEPEIRVGMAVDRLSVAPGASFTYTLHLNNTGSRAAPNAWVNLTLPASVSYVSDTAADLSGMLIGPTAWQFPQVANGPHAFTVTVAADAAAPGGAFLTATAHLDYTDSSGASQPSSIAGATVIVALKPKAMYLAHEGAGDAWDRMTAAPSTNGSSGPVADFDEDGNPGTTAGSATSNWTLTPGFFRPFRIRGAITVELFLNAPNAGGSSADLNVSLYDRRVASATYIASLETAVSVDGDATSYELVTFDLGLGDRILSAGNATELRVRKVAGDDLWVAYNRTDLPSRVIVTTSTYISIDRVELLDDRGPASVFSARDTVRIEANVSDPFGEGEIAGVRANVTDPDGIPIATDTPMSVVETDPAGASARFRHTYANPSKAGTYAFALTAMEGNGVESSAAGTFRVEFPVIELAVSRDIPSPRVGGIVTFTVTYNNVGTASAPSAWLNVSFPAGLAYVSDSSSGAKTGASNWTFADVVPAFRAFNLVAQVTDAPANGSLFVRFELAYSDAKAFVWEAPSRVTELTVIPPPPPSPFENPLVLFLIGVTVAGGSALGYWIWRSRQPKVEEAFLVHRDGVLLYHVSRSIGGEGEKDRDILGAMLTAVQEFVKDSFKYGERRDLNKLEFGDYEVLIERGNHVFLAVVLSSGNGEAEIRRRTRRTLEEVEAQFGEKLAAWGGDMEEVLGVRDLVRKLVSHK